jgi:formylglycine-generating enzyme required for sulfatase activity
MVRAAITFFVFVLTSSAALAAEKRVALIVGNSAYQHAPKLTNPKNDATDVAAALKKLGFQVVDGFDLDKAAFDRKVRDFAAALKGAEVGVLFYAGHGLQVAGENYLVPIDAKAEDATALEFEMLRVAVIHRIMEQQTNTNVLFLDACRDNPLARNLARGMGTRSTEIGKGLARIESGVGTLISFSTQPGNVALDGTGRNSPFAGALVKQFATSTDDLNAMLIAVRNEVMQETQRKQVPWENSALTGRFYFNQPSQTATPSAPSFGSSGLGGLRDAADAWDRTKDTANIGTLEAFVARFKDTYYADLARLRIEELRKQQVAAAKSEPAQKAKPPEPVEQKTALVEPLEQTKPKASASMGPAKPLTVEEERSLKPGETFKECDACPEMVVVPAGNFTMGSPEGEEGRRDAAESPQRKVTIAKPFAVGKFEVTFAEWDACIAAGGCAHKPNDHGWGRGKRPVVNVNWDDITLQYLPWLSRTSGKAYRLLTEAEWEYAARAGTTTPFSTGRTITPEQANFRGDIPYGGSAKGVYRRKPTDVGSFPSNAFGLHDMHGNVSEFVQDCYKYGYAGAPADGSAVTSADCPDRIQRGGNWGIDPALVRSAVRVSARPAYRFEFVGFRVARTL